MQLAEAGGMQTGKTMHGIEADGRGMISPSRHGGGAGDRELPFGGLESHFLSSEIQIAEAGGMQSGKTTHGIKADGSGMVSLFRHGGGGGEWGLTPCDLDLSSGGLKPCSPRSETSGFKAGGRRSPLKMHVGKVDGEAHMNVDELQQDIDVAPAMVDSASILGPVPSSFGQGVHGSSNMFSSSSPHSSAAFTKVMTNGLDSGQPIPTAHQVCTQGVWVNANANSRQPDMRNSGNMNSANPWFNKTVPWRKPRVVPLPLVDNLSPVSSEDVAILDDEAIDDTVRKLEHAIVGRMFGRRIPLHVLSDELRHRWGEFGKFRLITLSGDCFLCIFENPEACNAILLDGPWVILGQVLGVDRWTPSFSPSSSEGFRTPVWIRMPGLPLYCWSSVNISRIAAHVGEPMWMDSATAQLEKGLFARACVRLDLSKTLRPGIWVQGRHGKFFQPLEYEGLSVFCCHCAQVGHKASSCKIAGSKAGRCIGSPLVTPSASHVTLEAFGQLAGGSPKHNAAGGSPKHNASAYRAEAGPKTPCREVLKDADIPPEDKGVGPWMMVTRKKKSSKAAPPKNSWSASLGKPVAGFPLDPVADAGHSLLGSRSMQFETPFMTNLPTDSISPNACMKETPCTNDGSLPVIEEHHVFPSKLNPTTGSMSPIHCVVETHYMNDGSPQPAEMDQPISLVFMTLSKRERQLDATKLPTKPTTKARARGDKGRSVKKEKMVCELGPVTPGSQKRRKAQSITNGGDGSPFEEP